jgi:hypothetical protein
MRIKSCVGAVIFAVLGLSGCTPSYEDQSEALSKFARGNQIGGSPDYFLVKYGMAGPERIALIYGMAPDIEFCQEIANSYMAKYPASTYTCELAN